MLICVFGKRGSGKTTFIRGNVNNYRPPVIIVDILGNFNNKEFIHVKNESDLADQIKYYLENKNSDENLIDIFVLKPTDPDVGVDFASSILWNAAGGTLVLDEADGFSFANAPCYDQLVRYGRNRNVDIITGCRRPAEISRNITAVANKIFVFQTKEPRDIDYFESTVLGSEAEKLINLAQFHGLFVDYDKRVTGKYNIDKDGRVYILETVSSEIK